MISLAKLTFSEILDLIMNQLSQEQPVFQSDWIETLEKHGDAFFRWCTEWLDPEKVVRSYGVGGGIQRVFQHMDTIDENSFQDGLDIYESLDRMGASMDIAGAGLTPAAGHLLNFVFCHFSEIYLKVCNEVNHPSFLFPLVEKWPSNESVAMMRRMRPILCGIAMGAVWGRIQTTKGELQLIKDALNRNHFFEFVGHALEDMARKEFNNRTRHGSHYTANDIIEFLAKESVYEQWNDEEIDCFFDGLSGRVNRESWLVALRLANQLQSQAPGSLLPIALRKHVISEYPYLWMKNRQGRDPYLSGPETVELVRELANSFSQSVKDNEFNFSLNMYPIASEQELSRLLEIHRFGEYIQKRKLTFIHALLATFITSSTLEEQDINQGKWQQLCRLVYSVCSQLPDAHFVDGEKLVLEHLLLQFGQLYWRIEHRTDAMVRLMWRLPSPLLCVPLLRGMPVQDRDDLRLILTKVVKRHCGHLRMKERLDFMSKLLEAEEYELILSISPLVESKYDGSMEDHEFRRLHAIAVLNAYINQPLLLDVKYVHRAYTSLNVGNQRWQQNTQDWLLEGYLLCALDNRNEIDIATLRGHCYQLQYDKAPEVCWIRLLLCVRVLEQPQKDTDIHHIAQECVVALENIPDYQGLILLAKAYLAEYAQKDEEVQADLKLAKEYPAKVFQETKPFFPSSFHAYLDTMFGGSHAFR